MLVTLIGGKHDGLMMQLNAWDGAAIGDVIVMDDGSVYRIKSARMPRSETGDIKMKAVCVRKFTSEDFEVI